MDTIYLDKLPIHHNKEEIIEKYFDSKNLDLEIIFESKFTNTKHLRDFIEIIGKHLGFSEKRISRIILVSDELNNNAIEYGTDKDGKNILRIRTQKVDGELHFVMEVEDNGKGEAPKTALDMETMRAHKLKRGYFNHDSIRGRGLFLITIQIADRLYFKNSPRGGLIVGIKIHRKDKKI